MIDTEHLYEDELIRPNYRPIPVTGLKKEQIKTMNSVEPTRGGNVTPVATSPNGIRRPNQEIETRFDTAHQPLGHPQSIRVEARHSGRGALSIIRRILGGGRFGFRGLRTAEFAPSSIERELSGFLEKFSTGVARCRVSVAGHSKELKPAVQEQINLIARGALVNALFHSEATCVEAEVEYLPHRLRVVVRDNGRGIDPQMARTQTDAHWGFAGMRDRAESIGAKFTIWSRPGAGTEVEISVSSQAFANTSA